jgi:AbiTii
VVTTNDVLDMATSLIDELQLDASNPAVSVSSLLRKALMVAAKLELSDIPEWINQELSGYVGDDSLPPYRVVYGTVKAKGFGGRWVTVQFPTSEMHETISKNFIRDSVAKIEALIERDGNVAFGFPPELQNLLQSMFQIETEFFCFFEKTHLDGILDQIRTRTRTNSSESKK